MNDNPLSNASLRMNVLMTYCYLCGYAAGDSAAGGDGWVRAETLRDLEQTLLNLGMTETDVLDARHAALGGDESE